MVASTLATGGQKHQESENDYVTDEQDFPAPLNSSGFQIDGSTTNSIRRRSS
jgi:hypothetical protein